MSDVRKPRCLMALASLLLTALAGTAAAQGAEGSAGPRWVPDSAITVAITARLAAERFSRMTHLRIETDRGGVVSLSGHAGSRREAIRAASIARGIEGVLRVDNHIVIGPPAS